MDQDIIIKFCVVGEPSVGKTSMLYQYVHHKFDQKVRPTIGCDFSTKIKSGIDGKSVRLQLWDIAGQQRFSAVSKMYLRGALGCVIVSSAIEQTTLQETLKWKKIIEDNSDFGGDPAIPCLLVQNKSDLIQSNVLEPYQQPEFLAKFAKDNGFCGSIQCSAKENIKIQDIFQQLLDETIRRGLIKGTSLGKETKVSNDNIKLNNNNNKQGNVPVKRMKRCC